MAVSCCTIYLLLKPRRDIMFKVSFYSLFNLLSDFPFLLSLLLVVILKKVVFYKSPNPPSPLPPKHTHTHTHFHFFNLNFGKISKSFWWKLTLFLDLNDIPVQAKFLCSPPNVSRELRVFHSPTG